MGKIYDLVVDITKEWGLKYNRSLEEYLRSFLSVIRKRKNNRFDVDLLLKLVDEAFSTPPTDYSDDWLQYKDAPQIDFDIDGFLMVEETIYFQVSDLRQMKKSGVLENKYKYYGIKSDSNNSWYNFDVYSYLECAASGLEDHLDCGRVIRSIDDWKACAFFLELGRVYE